MINTVTIGGRLTRDMEVRSTNSGFSIGSMSVAVNDRRKNKQTGEWEDNPMFFDCKLLGRRAESLAPYLVKGLQVTVQGKLQQSRWDKDGQTRSKVEILVDEIQFQGKSTKQRVEEAFPGAQVYDDTDIPF